MMEAKDRVGRPRRTALPQTQIVVYLEVPLLEAIDRAADREGVSRSEWLRQAAKERLKASGDWVDEE